MSDAAGDVMQEAELTEPNPPHPKMVAVGDDAAGLQVPLDRVLTVVGSGPRCRLHLKSTSVSKVHAAIIRDGTLLFIRDLASREGIKVDGELVRECLLSGGERVKIGRFQFMLDRTDGGIGGMAPRAPVGYLGEVEIESRTLLIGRRDTSEIVIEDDRVSSAHALIVEIGGKRYIKDLASRTGVLVNGKAANFERLRDGDMIEIGGRTLRYAQAEPVDLEAELARRRAAEAAVLAGRGATTEQTGHGPDTYEVEAEGDHSANDDSVGGDLIPLSDGPHIDEPHTDFSADDSVAGGLSSVAGTGPRVNGVRHDSRFQEEEHDAGLNGHGEPNGYGKAPHAKHSPSNGHGNRAAAGTVATTLTQPVLSEPAPGHMNGSGDDSPAGALANAALIVPEPTGLVLPDTEGALDVPLVLTSGVVGAGTGTAHNAPKSETKQPGGSAFDDFEALMASLEVESESDAAGVGGVGDVGSAMASVLPKQDAPPAKSERPADPSPALTAVSLDATQLESGGHGSGLMIHLDPIEPLAESPTTVGSFGTVTPSAITTADETRSRLGLSVDPAETTEPGHAATTTDVAIGENEADEADAPEHDAAPADADDESPNLDLASPPKAPEVSGMEAISRVLMGGGANTDPARATSNEPQKPDVRGGSLDASPAPIDLSPERARWERAVDFRLGQPPTSSIPPTSTDSADDGPVPFETTFRTVPAAPASEGPVAFPVRFGAAGASGPNVSSTASGTAETGESGTAADDGSEPLPARIGKAELGKLLRSGSMHTESVDDGPLPQPPLALKVVKWIVIVGMTLGAAYGAWRFFEPAPVVKATLKSNSPVDPRALLKMGGLPELAMARLKETDPGLPAGELANEAMLARWVEQAKVEGRVLSIEVPGGREEEARLRALLSAAASRATPDAASTAGLLTVLRDSLKASQDALAAAKLKLTDLTERAKEPSNLSELIAAANAAQKKREAIETRLETLQSTPPVSDDAARAKLDAALTSFRRQLDEARNQPGADQRLSAFVQAVQNVQEQGAQLTESILGRRAEEAERLLMLKKRLDERMRIRQQQAWDADEELKRLTQQHETQRRKLEATDAGDVARRQDLQGELDYLDGLIKSRRALVGADRGDQRAVAEVQAIIEEQAKSTEQDQKLLAERFEQMRISLSKALPAAGTLPEPQRELAATLDARLTELQAARAALAEASAAAASRQEVNLKLLEAGLRDADREVSEKQQAVEQARSTVVPSGQLDAERDRVRKLEAEVEQARKTLGDAEAAHASATSPAGGPIVEVRQGVTDVPMRPYLAAGAGLLALLIASTVLRTR